MKKIIIFLIVICFILSLGCVSAGNNTTDDNLTPRDMPNATEITQATETGYLNITFSNGYNGYCLEYGEVEAKSGDNFYIGNTSYAINNNNNEEVGNYLKTFFVDYYDKAVENKIVTQHVIWHFTDNFTSSRIDPELIENIKQTASTKTIPDNGVLKVNNTTEMVYSFKILLASYVNHQNFFAYQIFFRDIINNDTDIGDNTTNGNNNTTQNNTTTIQNNTNIPENNTNIQNTTSYGNSTNNNNITTSNNTIKKYKSMIKSKNPTNLKRTGNNSLILYLAFTLLLMCYISTKKR